MVRAAFVLREVYTHDILWRPPASSLYLHQPYCEGPDPSIFLPIFVRLDPFLQAPSVSKAMGCE